METLVQKLCIWMEDKVTEAKAKGIVFGLSGGLDSAVVAALSIRIFPQNTLAIIIPCHSLEDDIYDALDFINKFDLSLIHISEPTRLGMISYAVFCLKKKKKIYYK